MTNFNTMSHDEILRYELARLKDEHRDLDTAIAAMHDANRGDALTLKRLKRQKLALKDRIFRIEDELNPDIIA